MKCFGIFVVALVGEFRIAYRSKVDNEARTFGSSCLRTQLTTSPLSCDMRIFPPREPCSLFLPYRRSVHLSRDGLRQGRRERRPGECDICKLVRGAF